LEHGPEWQLDLTSIVVGVFLRAELAKAQQNAAALTQQVQSLTRDGDALREQVRALHEELQRQYAEQQAREKSFLEQQQRASRSFEKMQQHKDEQLAAQSSQIAALQEENTQVGMYRRLGGGLRRVREA